MITCFIVLLFCTALFFSLFTMPEEKLADILVMLDLIGRYRKKAGQVYKYFYRNDQTVVDKK